MASTVTKTLPFQLSILGGSEQQLREATQEARDAYNETIRLAKRGVDWKDIPDHVAEDVALVKNTTQRVVAKALSSMENYYGHDDFNLPSHTKDGPFPLRANYTEGYNLFRRDGKVAFRISTKPYEHVTGNLQGDDAHLDLLKSALSKQGWKIGMAEALFRNGNAELHVTVTSGEHAVRDKQDSLTIVGMDLNEDNVALTALSMEGVEDTLVIDFPEVKFERHHNFTIRKRIQKSGKVSIFKALEGREKRFVRDRLHKVSRYVVEFCQQFEKPCIVFEDLKEMRDGLDYGVRMNRRLHHLPFRALQFYTSYKATFEGIPTAWINPEYTSQRCPVCGHTERGNRRKKRFKCRKCAHQDHSDRSASVNVAMKGVGKCCDWTVPALNSLPQVRKVRRQASGAVDAPAVTHDAVRGHQTDGVAGVFD